MLIKNTHSRLIAVPFSDHTSLSAIRRAQKEGMGAAELRIDLYSSHEKSRVLKEMKKFKNIPVIVTIRSKKEGGRWTGSEKERFELFQTVLPFVRTVDIELSSQAILKKVITEAHRRKKSVIVSFHDFRKTPSAAALEKIFKKAKAAGADLVKIAAMARSKKDMRILAEFTLSHAKDGVITLSMGKEGALSRILFPSLGSRLTFAHAGRSTAPGQMDLKTTVAFFQKLYS